MGTVYVLEEDAFVGKVDERLTVKADKKRLLDVPLIKVEGLVILGRATLSPALIIELLERHISVSYLTRTGRYLGRLEPEVTKNIFVRKAQWSAIGESKQAIHAAGGFIRGKLKNYRNTLLRRQRSNNEIDLKQPLKHLENAIASPQTD
jgi:CRISPR-associated protein Cas1